MIDKIYTKKVKSFSKSIGLHSNIRPLYYYTKPYPFLSIYDRKRLKKSCNECYEFGEQEEVTIDKYNGPSKSVINEHLKDIYGTYTFEKPFAAKIYNGRILAETGVCSTEDYSLLLDTANSSTFSIAGQNRSTQLELLIKQKRNPRVENYDLATATPLIRAPYSSHSSNYSHWLQSYLTKLQAIKKFEEKTGDLVTIVVEPNPPSWLIDSIKFYGFDDDRIHYWDPETELTVRNLIVPSTRRIEKNNNILPSRIYKLLSPNACDWLRENSIRRVQSSQSSLRTNKTNKVLIIRSDSPYGRKFINRNEVISKLSDYGFQPYILSDLSFKEQVELFSQSDIIIGAHGAGLSNMMFGKDCKVIEIMAENVDTEKIGTKTGIKPTFYLQSQCLGHEYYGVIGKGDGKNIHIDVDKIIDVL
jgi:hypothetical protein